MFDLWKVFLDPSAIIEWKFFHPFWLLAICRDEQWFRKRAGYRSLTRSWEAHQQEANGLQALALAYFGQRI